MVSSEYIQCLIEELKGKSLEPDALGRLKIRLCKRMGEKKIPTNIQILISADDEQRKKLKLPTKPGRTISGVAPVAIMSEPKNCPHGECTMCPSNVKRGVPQSYTGREPATMRAIRNRFDSYLQVFNRLEQYVLLGQNFQKVELIVMGGTFPSYDWSYQEEFVKYAFKAMNDFSKLFFTPEFDVDKFREFFELPCDRDDKEREKRVQEKILQLKGDCKLIEEQARNEKAVVRCVGLTLETRPDYAIGKYAENMLKLGATRVELGVQTVYDKVLQRIERGHSVQDSIKATRQLKDLCFKINYHVMPGLPGVDRKEDLEGLKKLFEDPDFRPDMIKIYPCMVVKDSKLYQEWKDGKFTPLSTKKAAQLIAEFKHYIPPYVRVMRVQRDIPTFMTIAGVDRTNLRQYIDRLKPKCRCIRCREVGHVGRKLGRVELVVHEYEASRGKEFFISVEDTKQDVLLGFVRLRFPSQTLRSEITEQTALIRELHVYGTATNLEDEGDVQHKGWGKKLMQRAEEIAMDNGYDKMVVISGVGVREYYRKLGYQRDGPYMVKCLSFP